MVLHDQGITTVQLEWISDWWATGAARTASDKVRRDLLDAAPVLGVDNIKVGADHDGTPASYDQLCAGFDALADDAARVGVKIGFENTPFGLIPTTEEAIRFVTDVADPNGGLILGIWHAQRGTTRYDSIPSLLPLDHLVGSSSTTALPELLAKAFLTRSITGCSAGTGDFDVPAFIRTVERIGWTGPWGIEHMSIASRQGPISEVLSGARQTALDCFE